MLPLARHVTTFDAAALSMPPATLFFISPLLFRSLLCLILPAIRRFRRFELAATPRRHDHLPSLRLSASCSRLISPATTPSHADIFRRRVYAADAACRAFALLLTF